MTDTPIRTSWETLDGDPACEQAWVYLPADWPDDIESVMVVAGLPEGATIRPYGALKVGDEYMSYQGWVTVHVEFPPAATGLVVCRPKPVPAPPATEKVAWWEAVGRKDVEVFPEVAAERDALRGMVRRYHAGWYIVSASAPLRDVWCKDHYPDDGYVTEELTSAEADAFRRALDASPTEVCTACGDRGRPECEVGNCDVPADASPTEGNPDGGITVAVHQR